LTDDLTWDDNEADHYTRASQGDIYHP